MNIEMVVTRFSDLSVSAIYIILGVLIGVFTIILIAVSIYFIKVYRK